MSVRVILQGERNVVLRTAAQRIQRKSPGVSSLLKDLKDTVASAAGVGLAAPQIGVGRQACVVKMGGEFVPLLNPEIIWRSEEEEVMEEGCLSLPGVAAAVPRATSIILQYRDEKWEKQERKISGLEARIVQHEVDHLHGILIVDYTSPPRARRAAEMTGKR